MARLTVTADEEQLSDTAADRLTRCIEQAVAQHGSAFVSLTGGTTPRRLYSHLADPHQPWRQRIPWSQVHLFWGDERHVPPEHPDSNYGMARAALIDHVAIPDDHVHRIHGEMPDARAAAAESERALDVASALGRRDAFFDVMLLGLGEDAHVASIFPGSELLSADTVGPLPGRRVVAVWAAHLNRWRVTLTPAAILDSRAILVLVSGTRKADAVKNAIEGPLDVAQCPAQLLRAAGDRVEWLVDRAAAAHLTAR